MLNKTKIIDFKIIDLLLLTVVFSLLFFLLLGVFPIEPPDAARYAEIPREMLARLDFITPHLDGLKYFEKPPLFYWLQVISFKIFGLNDFAAHFMNALIAIISCLLTYLIGNKLYSRTAGIAASLVLATSTLYFGLARIVTLDMAFTLFFSTTLYSFLAAEHSENPATKRNYLWCMYASAALATLTKGLIGFILPGLIILLWFIVTHNFNKLKTYHLISGAIIFLAIALPWHLVVQMRNPEFFHFYIIKQHFLRYFTPYAGRVKPLYYLTLLFIGGLMPWAIFLPTSLKNYLPRQLADLRYRPITTLILLWPLTILLFFSVSHSQLPPYILPMFPPVALILGNFFAQKWLLPKKSQADTITFISLFIITTLISLGLIIATRHLDFSEEMLRPIHFYVVATMTFLTGLSSFIIYFRCGNQAAFYTLVGGWMLLLLSATPIISMANDKSVKPLIDIIKPKLDISTQIATYDDYFQDIPYYLGRRVMVINFLGELAFGARHGDGATKDYIMNDDKFFPKWNSDQKIILFADKGLYNKLKQNSKPGKFYLIAVYLKTMLVANYNYW